MASIVQLFYRHVHIIHKCGIVALRREHYEKINGLSNQFWGWGGEDDDMYKRIINNGLKITRYKTDIARYTTIKHKKAKVNPDRFRILKQNNGRCVFSTIAIFTKSLYLVLGLMMMGYPPWHIDSSQVIHMIFIQILLYNFTKYLAANYCYEFCDIFCVFVI